MACIRPPSSYELAMPTKQRVRTNEERRPALAAQQPAGRGQEYAVGLLQPRPGDLAAQVALAGGDLLIEGVDQGEAGRRRRPPGLGQGQPLEQPPAADAEEVAARAGDAVGDQDRMDAVL